MGRIKQKILGRRLLQVLVSMSVLVILVVASTTGVQAFSGVNHNNPAAASGDVSLCGGYSGYGYGGYGHGPGYGRHLWNWMWNWGGNPGSRLGWHQNWGWYRFWGRFR